MWLLVLGRLLTINQKYANSLSALFGIAFVINVVSKEVPKIMVKIKTIFFQLTA